MRKLQTFDSPFYTMRVPLDGTQYQLSFAWNHRTETWSFDLDDASGNAIVHGLRVMTGVPLLARYHYLTSCPPGELVCTSKTPDDSPPNLEDLADGARCQLVYAPLLDLIAWGQGNYLPSENG
jgi:hypothetical protein